MSFLKCELLRVSKLFSNQAAFVLQCVVKGLAFFYLFPPTAHAGAAPL